MKWRGLPMGAYGSSSGEAANTESNGALVDYDAFVRDLDKSQ